MLASSRRHCIVLVSAVAMWALSGATAWADENGTSFWLPGLYGSFAAAPVAPGWALWTSYYHTTVSAGSSVASSRDFQVRGVPVSTNATRSTNINGNIDLFLATPSYTFDTPILGGQFSVGLMALIGANATSLGAALTGAVSSPFGSLSVARTAAISQSVFAIGDLYPQASLRWNFGVHNLMAYLSGDIPVGYYDSKGLANVGMGHGAIDGGGAYTYLDPMAGHEASVALGFTYNFQNPATQYQNGVDMHLDLGAAQFLNEHLFFGAVGYLYKQIGCDVGSAPGLGCFRSQVMGAGPQLGVTFPVAGKQAIVTFKSYQEFAAENRPSGFNVWLSFAISNAPPSAPAPRAPLP